MCVVVRGTKTAFRNWLRTAAVVLILAIGIGLSLSMLVAKQAVESKISDLKSQVGSVLTVNPAGAQGQQGGGEPLTNEMASSLKGMSHVTSVSATTDFMLQNQDATSGQGVGISARGPSGEIKAGKTNLVSAVDAGTLGRRFNSAGENKDFKLPIRGIGTSGNMDSQGKDIKITSGRALSANDTASALVGTDLATKNNLKVGSTFTAYDTTLTVVGIFDQGTKFGNNTVAIPLSQAQILSGQTGQVGQILVKVDSIENLDTTANAIKTKLGSDKVDVVSSQQNIQTAVDSLKSVQQISVIGFIAALVASAVITFLIMLVVVRERRREIGVLKAIGGSNRTIVMQFVVEALVLVFMAGVVGFGIAIFSSNGIANALVTSNNSSQNQGASNQSSGPMFVGGRDSISKGARLVGNVTTSVGSAIMLWGVVVALAIAVVGSAVPAWLIAKVRPAEVMRGE